MVTEDTTTMELLSRFLLSCFLAMWAIGLDVVSAEMAKDKAALVIIDVQNCFLEGGTLAVNQGNDVIPVIKKLRKNYRERLSLVVMTQDWHCPDHVSFASQHIGKQPYSVMDLQYDSNGNLCITDSVTSKFAMNCSSVAHDIKQTLWPDHCVINTTDAQLSNTLGTEYTDFIVRKGYHCQVDSYSAFYDNGGFGQTELNSRLLAANITSVYIVGIARDFCVFFTAKDAKKLGYKTYVILDATRGVAQDTSEAAVAEMAQKGINLINSDEAGYYLPPITHQEEKSALIVIDVQNCFLLGGSLAVTEGNEVIPVINNIRSKYGNQFDLVVFTQDWHCADHVSFASQYQNKNNYETVFLAYDAEGNLCETDEISNKYTQSCPITTHNISQTLWPDHCIMNTAGAELSKMINMEPTDIIVKKGNKCQIDSYSAFYDNGGFTQTQLDGILRQNNISTVYVTGLAIDICVYYTSLDAKKLGYKTYVVKDASRAITAEGSIKAITDMTNKGIHLISSKDIKDTLPEIGGTTPGGPASCSEMLHTHFMISYYIIVSCTILVYFTF